MAARRVAAGLLLVGAALFITWSATRPDASLGAVGPTAIERAVVDPVASAAPLADGDRRSALPAVELGDPVDATPTRFRLWGMLRGTVFVGGGAAPQITCRDSLGVERSTRTDASLRYEFDGLEPGRYWLRASSAESSVRAEVDLRGTRRVDLELRATPQLDVRVLDENGEPWAPPGVDAVVTRTDPGPRTNRRRMSARIAAFQSPRATPFPPDLFDRIRVTWPTPFHVSLVLDGAVLATQFVRAGETEVVFHLRRDDPRTEQGSVRFRIVEPDSGALLFRDRVQLQGREPVRVEWKDGVGSASLRPGRWALRGFGKPNCVVFVPFQVEPGAEVDLGDIVPCAGACIRGRVVDELGRGIAASVECEPCDEHGVIARIGDNIHGFGTRDDGTFEICGIARGLHRVAPRPGPQTSRSDEASAHEPRIVDLREGDASGIVLRFVPGTVLVVRPSGRETVDSAFRVRTREGVVVATQPVSLDGPQRMTLAPGSYDVEMWHETGGPETRVRVELAREPVGVDMP